MADRELPRTPFREGGQEAALLGSGVQALVDRLEARVAPPTPEETRFYGWQPLPLLDFLRGMAVIGEGRRRRFLDVGSGIGSKLYIAHCLGFEAHGIERHGPYVALSHQLFPECQVTAVDAFNWGGYDRFDVVFCYRPCVDPVEQERLNHIIASQLKPEAFFFSAGGPWPDWLEDLGNQVYRTPKN